MTTKIRSIYDETPDDFGEVSNYLSSLSFQEFSDLTEYVFDVIDETVDEADSEDRSKAIRLLLSIARKHLEFAYMQPGLDVEMRKGFLKVAEINFNLFKTLQKYADVEIINRIWTEDKLTFEKYGYKSSFFDIISKNVFR